VLFSSDITLGYEQLIDYYRLRFQLEFNFRDAKQYSTVVFCHFWR
jgi:putative transposase